MCQIPNGDVGIWNNAALLHKLSNACGRAQTLLGREEKALRFFHHVDDLNRCSGLGLRDKEAFLLVQRGPQVVAVVV